MRMPAGLARAAHDAVAMGCESVQLFSGNPNSWNPGKLNPQEAERFCEITLDGGVRPVVLHTAYLLNLASPDPGNYQLSTRGLCEAMRRADALGARYVVTHIGSHKGTGLEEGIQHVVEASIRALECSREAAVVLEGSSGVAAPLGGVLSIWRR